MFSTSLTSSARFTKGFALLVVSILIAAVLSVLAPALTASAATATLTVNVTGGGEKAGGVSVDLYEYIPAWEDYEWISGQTTGSAVAASEDYDPATAGVVKFTGITTGSSHKYVVVATPWSGGDLADGSDISDYTTTYLGSSTQYARDAAGTFTLSGSGSKTVALKAGFTISGTVYEADGSTPFTESEPSIQTYKLNQYGFYDFANSAFGDVANGSYTVKGLAPGSYKIRFDALSNPNWGGVWYGNVANRAASTVVNITTTSVTGIDASLSDPGTINGTVTYLGGALPDNAYASVSASSMDSGSVVADFSTEIQPDGTYSISLAPGSYRLSFYLYDFDTNSEHAVWFDNAPTFGTATTMTVTTGSNAVANGDLTDGFSFSGTVTDAAHTPLGGWSVELQGIYDEGTSGSAGSQSSAVDGSFEITGMAPGAYNVELHDTTGDDPNTYYLADDGTVTTNSDNAEVIRAVSGTVTRDITFPVTASALVTVLSPAGTPVKGAYVSLLPSVNGVVSWDNSIYADQTTSSSGVYSAVGLAAGQDYTVYVGATPTGSYDQFLGGAFTEDEATLFTADAGKNTITFSLSPAISITGKVTSSSGKAIKSAVVWAYYFDGSSWVSVWPPATTSSSGTWSMKGLRAGSYKFEVSHPYGSTFIDAYSGNTSSLETAAAVYIGPGKTASVTVKLQTGGTLSGVVKGEGGATFHGYGLASKLIGNPTDGFTGTEEVEYYGDVVKGKLVFAGLPTGYYSVGYAEYQGIDAVYPFTYIGGASPLEATAFSITAGKTTTFPTVTALAHPGTASLSGHFSAPGGDLDQEYSLTYYRVGAQDSMDYVTVGTNGSYSIPDLTAGDYVLGLETGHGYPQTFTYEPFVTTVTVGSGATTADFSLTNYDPLVFSSEPTVPSDDLRVGESATVTDGITNYGADYTYQWYRQTAGPDTRAIIRGANDATYEARPSDFGSTLFVRVTATQTIGNGEFTVGTKSVTTLLSTGSVLEGFAPQNLVKPSISPSGTVLTDTVLHASPGTWDQHGLTYSYQWYVNGFAVAGAAGTGKSYTVTAANGQENDAISVGVIAHGSNRGDSDDEMSTPVTGDTAAAPTITKAPKISVKGSLFTASGAQWSRSGTSVDYVWSVDGGDSSAGSSFTYTGTGAVSVEVSGVKTGYETGYKTYLARKGTTPPSVVDIAPYVDGVSDGDEVPVGIALQAFGGVAHFTDGSVNDTATYQWYSAVGAGTPKAISKATKSTYTPTVADVGKIITVIVKISNANYGPYSYTAAGGTVAIGELTFSSGTTVTGFPNLGRTLTAHPAHYAESGVTYTYAWYTVDGFDLTAIAGATKSTYVPTEPAVLAGQSVAVIVGAHKAGYEVAESGSTPLEIGDGSIQNLTAPVVSPGGIVTTGTTLTATAGTWDVASPTISYQWMRNGGIIAGATSKTYKVTVDDADLPITVVVHASKSGFAPSADVSSNTVTGHASGVSTEAPVVNDTLAINSPEVGAATGTSQSAYDLFYYPGGDDSANPKLTYQWYLGSSAIKGATSATYTPPATAAGKSLWLKVTVTSPYYAKMTQSTTPQPVATGAPVVGSASITPGGTWILGTKLTAVPSGWSSASKLSYQWQRDTGSWANIAGATKSTYTLTAADVNANVRVIVTSTRTGYTTADIASDDGHVFYTDSVEWLEGPTLTGTAATGGTLSVSTGVLNTSGVAFSYQWYANGKSIPGATSSSIVIAPALAGHTLSATVEATKAGYNGASAETNELPVANATAAVLSGKGPKISADNSTCNRLKATPGTWSVGGLSFTYQWYSGAVGTTTELLSSDATYDMASPAAHALVWVKVTAHGIGYDGTANSAAFTETPTGSCG
jgi:hypothetical protein